MDAQGVSRMIVTEFNTARGGKTRGDRYQETLKRTKALRKAGNQVIEVLGYEVGKSMLKLPQRHLL